MRVSFEEDDWEYGTTKIAYIFAQMRKKGDILAKSQEWDQGKVFLHEWVKELRKREVERACLRSIEIIKNGGRKKVEVFVTVIFV